MASVSERREVLGQGTRKVIETANRVVGPVYIFAYSTVVLNGDAVKDAVGWVYEHGRDLLRPSKSVTVYERKRASRPQEEGYRIDEMRKLQPEPLEGKG